MKARENFAAENNYKGKSALALTIILLTIFISCKSHRVRELENHLGFELENDSVHANIETRSETDGSGYFINIYRLTNNEINEIRNDNSWSKMPLNFQNKKIELLLNEDSEYFYKSKDGGNIELIADISNKQIIYSKIIQ